MEWRIDDGPTFGARRIDARAHCAIVVLNDFLSAAGFNIRSDSVISNFTLMTLPLTALSTAVFTMDCGD